MGKCLKSGFDYCKGEPMKRKVQFIQEGRDQDGKPFTHTVTGDVCILDPETCGQHMSSTEVSPREANSAVGYRPE